MHHDARPPYHQPAPASAGGLTLLLALAGGTALSQPYPPVLPLDDLAGGDGSVGVALDGAGISDGAGTSIASAGDVNGDGFEDLLVGAPLEFLSRGELYVIFGGPGFGDDPVIQLSSLDGTDGFSISGLDTNHGLGDSVAAAGDFDGDGIDDFLVGASLADPGNRTNAGAAYLVYGAPGIGASGSFDLATLNGTNGVALEGALSFDRAGRAVAGGGDVNDDGFSDVAVGATQCSAQGNPLPGEAYFVYGGGPIGAGGRFDLGSLATGGGLDGFVVPGLESCDDVGRSLAFTGDVNADGADDVAIGAPSVDFVDVDNPGQAYVLFGGTGVGGGGVVDIGGLDGSNGFTVSGIEVFDFVGSSVSGAGDVDGDGVEDLLIGADGADMDDLFVSGQALVFYGNAALGASGELTAADLDGGNGFVLASTIDQNEAGESAVRAGDVDGDGFDDLFFGGSGNFGAATPGHAYLRFGGPRPVGEPLALLSELDGTNGLRLDGVMDGDQAGFAVAAGDFDADGRPDVVVGAPDAEPNGVGSGQVYVVFGRTPPPPLGLTVPVLTAGASATLAVTGAPAGGSVFFVVSLSGFGATPVPLDVTVALESPILLGNAPADASGTAELDIDIPASASGRDVWFQAVVTGNVSPVTATTVN